VEMFQVQAQRGQCPFVGEVGTVDGQGRLAISFDRRHIDDGTWRFASRNEVQ
jgi:hypothetical protein